MCDIPMCMHTSICTPPCAHTPHVHMLMCTPCVHSPCVHTPCTYTHVHIPCAHPACSRPVCAHSTCAHPLRIHLIRIYISTCTHTLICAHPSHAHMYTRGLLWTQRPSHPHAPPMHPHIDVQKPTHRKRPTPRVSILSLPAPKSLLKCHITVPMLVRSQDQGSEQHPGTSLHTYSTVALVEDSCSVHSPSMST